MASLKTTLRVHTTSLEEFTELNESCYTYGLLWKCKSVRCSVMSLCNPMDCILPASSVHGILQARMLEWVAISFSRGSFQPRDQTQVSCITGRFFTTWATREATVYYRERIQIKISQGKKYLGWISGGFHTHNFVRQSSPCGSRMHDSQHQCVTICPEYCQPVKLTGASVFYVCVQALLHRYAWLINYLSSWSQLVGGLIYW